MTLKRVSLKEKKEITWLTIISNPQSITTPNNLSNKHHKKPNIPYNQLTISKKAIQNINIHPKYIAHIQYI